ncbi:M12 family metallopeptidase [Asticcacaulis sp. YBE204]|uniref:M12 family metallopeptidase n=1 Tax=Asticcacaulis sp. YBE204 TaxID=1282363 RepID=UPI0003C3D687|nr:M12 family metallopeptidase [Asticcacaulis sp. YBE204]ESQ79990.1 hypothetical protein AEYBE204_09075 [Asticcacaulis sp. YBE204]
MKYLIFAVMMLWAGLVQAAAVPDWAQPWKDGVVPYRIEPLLLARAGAMGQDCTGWDRWPKGAQARLACQAMDDWHRASGVRFVHDPRGRLDALMIRDGDATTATIGHLPLNNRVTIERGIPYGSVLHEFGHVLGLMHEHQRPDRDTYLTIEPFLNDLLKTCGVGTAVCRDVRLSFPAVGRVRYASDYDPCSLMHYLANQAPRHREDPRWSRIFTLSDKGKTALKTCLPQFRKLAERCRKVGQKCVISKLDADVVRRFHTL